MASPEKQHLVSKGYQANFASRPSKRVTILEPSTGRVIENERPISTNWRIPEYTSTLAGNGDSPDNKLERFFGSIEVKVLNEIRRIDPTHRGESQRQAVIQLFAMHLVRNETYRHAHDRIMLEVVDADLTSLTKDSKSIQRIEEYLGHAVKVEEVAALIRAFPGRAQESNDLHVDNMRNSFERIAEILSVFHLQIITSDGLDHGFALGDVPVVHYQTTSNRYGIRDGLAIGDADLIIGPLTRTTAVALSRVERKPLVLSTKKTLQCINAVFARSALRELACHPEDAHQIRRTCEHLDRFPVRKLLT